VTQDRTVLIRPPMTSAGAADVRALRTAAFDALVVRPDQLVIDLQGFRWSRELRQAVLDIREEVRRKHPAVVLVVEGRDTGG
jgi:hypothetical protein